MPKFCKDCVYYSTYLVDDPHRLELQQDFIKCINPVRQEPNLVTAFVYTRPSCKDERNSTDPMACGPDAKYYKPTPGKRFVDWFKKLFSIS